MAEAPLTRPSLLVRLRDLGDQEAWRQFVDRGSAFRLGAHRKPLGKLGWPRRTLAPRQ